MIFSALEELNQLDVRRHIFPLYIPLTLQQGAKPVLEKLLETHFIAEKVPRRSFGRDPPLDKTRKDARKKTAEVLKRLPRSAKARPLVTDKSLLDAVLTVATLYAEAHGTRFFLNESWTLQDSNVIVRMPSRPNYGMILAAVGNAPNEALRTKVHLKQWDFAQQSSGDSVVAIMNMDDAGNLICCSNETLDDDGINAVGFDGRLAESDVSCGPGATCGTSFAAPRVGWLLALNESVKSKQVTPHLWSMRIKSMLKTSRGTVQGIGKFRISVNSLLQDMEANSR